MELPKTALPVKGSIDHWVDVDGSIYAIDHRNGHHKLIKKSLSEVYGYKYVGIKYKNEKHNISKRVHRLVAEAFIPNPMGYTVVGHKNNIKNDNRVDNLYWTTTSENTQKAFDDGLAKNASGFEDSQSNPVSMYETSTNSFIKTYGSIREAANETGISLSTISRQAKYKRPVRKKYYFRFIDDPDVLPYNPIGMYAYDSDEMVERFESIKHARDKTGVDVDVIKYHLDHGKPKRKFSDFYFKVISNS